MEPKLLSWSLVKTGRSRTKTLLTLHLTSTLLLLLFVFIFNVIILKLQLFTKEKKDITVKTFYMFKDTQKSNTI